ncbi:hypothetical protein N0V88_003553 [Collariella sp. IMI 366227]|nr:hypothetical protein N0V88_003553 [Collariella sp. IMI 366227]
MEYRQRTGDLAMDGRRRIEKAAIEEHREPRYHVYVRLPFNRGNFVDPGTVNWNEKKSEALWSILSGSSADNFNWTRLATQFDVSVDFLLQMANYLTERHTTQLRAQMLKAAAFRGSNAPSPVPGADDPARRTASAAGRAPSALSIRKDAANQVSRTEEEPSGGAGINAPRPVRQKLSTIPARKLSKLVRKHRRPFTKPASLQARDSHPVERPSTPPALIPTHPGAGNGRGPFEDDDNDDDEPAFLPFKPQSNPVQGTRGSSTRHDLGATLRGNMRDLAIGRRTATDGNQSQTSDSSAGSAAIVPRRPSGTAAGTALPEADG